MECVRNGLRTPVDYPPPLPVDIRLCTFACLLNYRGSTGIRTRNSICMLITRIVIVPWYVLVRLDSFRSTYAPKILRFQYLNKTRASRLGDKYHTISDRFSVVSRPRQGSVSRNIEWIGHACIDDILMRKKLNLMNLWWKLSALCLAWLVR